MKPFQTFRLYNMPASANVSVDSSAIQLIFDLGPIDDGAEVVTKFWTDLQTSVGDTGTQFRLFTDDNGLELQV